VIGAKRVTAPDGTTWQVGRRWLPDKPEIWRRDRGRDRDSPAGDVISELGFAGFSDSLAAAAIWFVAVVLIVVLTIILLPFLVLVLEILLVALLLVGGLGGRLFLRKPWTIRARSDEGRELTWRASGWRRSGRVRDDAAAALALGQTDVRPSEALEPARP
jgi:hypothetical protein